MKPDTTKISIDCDICGMPFSYSHNQYDGRRIVSWDVWICHDCAHGNWDGLIPEHHPDFIAKLQAKGIKLDLDENQLLHIPPIGS